MRCSAYEGCQSRSGRDQFFFCFFLEANPRSATEWSGAGREAASPTATGTLRLLHPRRARFFLLKAFFLSRFFLRRPFRPRGAKLPVHVRLVVPVINPAIASLLQSKPPAGRVAELGSRPHDLDHHWRCVWWRRTFWDSD